MTALNIAVCKRQAVIVTDSLISSSEPQASFGTKAVPFAVQRLVVAGSGHLAFLDYTVLGLMRGMPAATNAADLAAALPDGLASYWKQIGASRPSKIVIVGATTEETVGAFVLQSPAFSPESLKRGVYVSPGLQVESVEGAPARPPSETAAPIAAPPPEIAGVPWHHLVRTAVDAVELQLARYPEFIGGPLIVTTIGVDAIHQTVLRDLSHPGDAP